MTIEITPIEGRRGSVCNNDAFSVVFNTGLEVSSIAIIPREAVAGKDPRQIQSIFVQAVQGRSPAVVEEVRQACKRQLPLLIAA
jgi:hypothetical protein